MWFISSNVLLSWCLKKASSFCIFWTCSLACKLVLELNPDIQPLPTPLLHGERLSDLWYLMSTDNCYSNAREAPRFDGGRRLLVGTRLLLGSYLSMLHLSRLHGFFLC